VQTENGELVTAAIKRSDTFEFATFMDEIKSKTHEALAGRDRAADDLSLILSYTAGRTILFGTPLLVAPAVATLFFGIPDQERRKPDGQAYLSLTFDHRLINGVEATAFLDAIANQFAQTELDDDKQATRQAERGGDKLRTRESLEAALIDKLVELLSITADEIDEQESLGLLGLDSIKAITLKNYLEQLFSMALPATLLWHCPNVKSLLDYCASAQKLSSQKIATQKAADVEETAASTEELGDVELYIGYSVTGIGYMLQYAVDQALAGNWKPGYKPFGLAMGPQASAMIVCNAPPEVEKKIRETEQAIRDGKIKTLDG